MQPHLGALFDPPSISHNNPVCSVHVGELDAPNSRRRRAGGDPPAAHKQVRSFSSSPLKNGHISGLQTGVGFVITSHKNPVEEEHVGGSAPPLEQMQVPGLGSWPYTCWHPGSVAAKADATNNENSQSRNIVVSVVVSLFSSVQWRRGTLYFVSTAFFSFCSVSNHHAVARNSEGVDIAHWGLTRI